MSRERTFWVAPVRREIEDGEGVLFKEKFFNWSSTLPIQMQQAISGKNVAGALAFFLPSIHERTYEGYHEQLQRHRPR